MAANMNGTTSFFIVVLFKYNWFNLSIWITTYSRNNCFPCRLRYGSIANTVHVFTMYKLPATPIYPDGPQPIHNTKTAKNVTLVTLLNSPGQTFYFRLVKCVFGAY